MKSEVKVTICPPADCRVARFTKAQEIRAKLMASKVRRGKGRNKRTPLQSNSINDVLYRRCWNDEIAERKEKLVSSYGDKP